MWLGELAGIKHPKKEITSVNSRDQLRELVSTLSIAQKKPISSRRNASITTPVENVRSNHNNTPFG
jgi:hypothetical protein